MKVSSKIISGFLVLMMLAIIVIANQLSAINQMEAANRELFEINLKSATTVIELQKLADLIGEDSKKYFALNDPVEYARQIEEVRSDFIEDLARLRQTANSERQQKEIVALQQALDGYWDVFNQLKQ